ncbi:MAG TPA: WYL domain-containing protein [Microlunatus sp.]|nr:WYL domain-containing protein [Microlunatus sp.]
MERLLRILLSLSEADDQGLPARRLCRVAGYPVDRDAGVAALRRDLRRLRQGGWDIENRGGDGFDGHYLLHAQDNRMALLLTAGERAALQQALHTATGADAPAQPEFLGELERAVERHCLTRFRYRNVPRTVHPHTLHNGPSGWMLRGLEVESGTVKEFVVNRMADQIEIDQPGTAELPAVIPRLSFDPMTWQVDPPLEARLLTSTAFEPDVLRLMTGGKVVERHGENIVVTVTVTHRAAFRSRVCELGLRVRVIGPPDSRDRVIRALRAVAEAPA